jgi:hypothetical protein
MSINIVVNTSSLICKVYVRQREKVLRKILKKIY